MRFQVGDIVRRSKSDREYKRTNILNRDWYEELTVINITCDYVQFEADDGYESRLPENLLRLVRRA